MKFKQRVGVPDISLAAHSFGCATGEEGSTASGIAALPPALLSFPFFISKPGCGIILQCGPELRRIGNLCFSLLGNLESAANICFGA